MPNVKNLTLLMLLPSAVVAMPATHKKSSTSIDKTGEVQKSSSCQESDPSCDVKKTWKCQAKKDEGKCTEVFWQKKCAKTCNGVEQECPQESDPSCDVNGPEKCAQKKAQGKCPRPYWQRKCAKTCQPPSPTHTFVVKPALETFSQSSAVCKTDGGNLAVPRSQAQMDQIMQAIGDGGVTSGPVWLGAYRRSNGHWFPHWQKTASGASSDSFWVENNGAACAYTTAVGHPEWCPGGVFAAVDGLNGRPYHNDPPEYYNWANGQPLNHHGGDAMIVIAGSEGKWRARAWSSAHRHPSVCEYEA